MSFTKFTDQMSNIEMPDLSVPEVPTSVTDLYTMIKENWPYLSAAVVIIAVLIFLFLRYRNKK
jgi:hypothetical protein